jgi:zinc/manganese transport system substrate-binding protein
MKGSSIGRIVFFALTAFITLYAVNGSASINVVAAENVYGEVAKELGGPYVSVVSILKNPAQDPHLFTTTPSTAKAVHFADIVIYNGAGYDPWMTSLLTIQGQKNRHVIEVASLINVKSGENPHLWYLPTTMPVVAKALVSLFIQRDPLHQQYYENQWKHFNTEYQQVLKKVDQLKQKFQNTSVIATEPVFGHMVKSIGLKMHDEAFQINMMNDIPPTISQVKEFEDDLQHHSVRVFIYNDQVLNPTAKQMRQIAEKEKISVLGVRETMPEGITYTQWMMQELDKLETALEKSHKD